MGNAFIYGQSSGNAASIEGLVDGATIQPFDSMPVQFYIIAPLASLKANTNYIYFGNIADESGTRNVALMGGFRTPNELSNTYLTSYSEVYSLMTAPADSSYFQPNGKGLSRVQGQIQDDTYRLIFYVQPGSGLNLLGEPTYFALYEIH